MSTAASIPTAEAIPTAPHVPVAVVGVACLLPGARSPEEFWATLADGADRRTEGDREIFGTDRDVPGGWGDSAHRVTATRGGFVTEPEVDLRGLRVPAEQLDRLDRVVRWPLAVAREALADAGIAEDDPVLARTGLALGNYSFPTESSSNLAIPLLNQTVTEGLRRAGANLPGPAGVDAPDADEHNLWAAGLPATTLADAFGLGGPTLSLDAACSSALYSLSLARDYLATGRADVMLTGAVCAPDPLLIHLSFSDLQAYPDNGVSQPFDSSSRGIVTGQGAGILVLKRLADAQRAGDRIHAVIDAVGLTNDGAGRHVLIPNPAGQLDAYRHAYARIDPAMIDYLECHATGTPLGDSTELRGLAEFFGPRGGVPPLGSVKANLGHLLTVAGFSSLLKVMLAMRHGVLPATPGVHEPLRVPGAEDVAERVVRTEQPWPRPKGGARRAGVSAFGFGGTNAHVVISAPPRPEDLSEDAEQAPPPAASAPLAVVGLGIRAGSITGVAELDRVVRTGTPDLRDAPPKRWYGLDDTSEADPPVGGYLTDVEVDVPVYRIPPAELGHANPQHLAFFAAADQALTDAGLAGGDREPRRVGVVVAMDSEPHTHAHRSRFDIGAHVLAECERAGLRLSDDELDRLQDAARAAMHPDLGVNEVLSYIGNIMASRVSSARNFTGPSFTIAGDATVGARALEIAGLLLRDPTVEAVLVGGVDLAAGGENTVARARLAAKAGDTLPHLGDGAAAVVVMRPGDVPADGRSYATIDGLALRGPGHGDSRWGADPVEAAAREALAAAGLAAADVDHLELGGLTKLSGQAELTALAQVYRTDPDADRHEAGCLVGRLGDLTGDLQRASVLAALVKVASCLRHAELPPAPDGVQLDPRTVPALEGSALRVPAQRRPWLRRHRDRPRTATISALGHRGPGGWHAAHLVLSDGVRNGTATADWSAGGGPLLLPLRADDGHGLAALAGRYRAELAGGADPAVLVGRAVREDRPGRVTAVVVATDGDRLDRELERAEWDLPASVADGRDWATPAGSYCSPAPLGVDAKIAFVYPGAFTTYPGAGQDLFRLFPGLLTHFERTEERPRRRFKQDALHPAATPRMDRGALMRHEAGLVEDIPTMLATGTNLAVLYTRLLRDVLGVRPHGGFGYSLGESSMLFANEVWAESGRDDAVLTATPLFRDQLRGRMEVVRRAWNLPEETPDKAVWSTHVLLAAAADVREPVSVIDRVHLTHVNTPREVVIAGAPDACAEVIAKVGCQAARVPANHVMHNALVEPVADQLRGLNTYHLGDPDPELELLSVYDYDRVDVGNRDRISARIARTLCGEVDFPRLVRSAYDRGFRYFVEVGPGATCTRWIGETLGDAPHMAVSVDRRGTPTGSAVAAVLARLVSHGLPVDLPALLPEPAPARKRMLVTVQVGAESAVEQVRRVAAEVLPAATRPAATRHEEIPSEETPHEEMEPVTPDESIVLEDEPFVYLPEPVAAPQPVAAPVPVAAQEPAAAPEQGLVASAPAPAAPAPMPAPVPALRPAGVGPIRVLAETVAAAHLAAMRAQDAVANRLVDRLLGAGGVPQVAPPPDPASAARPDGVIWDENDLLEFARGSVAKVFGERFAEVDTYPYRVRLPEPPYLFVSRVTDLQAETGRFEPSRITTEYDIPEDPWFGVDGLAPTAVTVEAGQCDLMLISYLGIDFASRGQRVYRLLDSTLQFHTGLPRAGQTLRYEISINRFVRDGDTLLFFFSYRCFADGELCMELLDACAGFFTAEELEDSLGVVTTEADRRRRAAMTPAWFTPLARTDRTALSPADLELLAEGKPAAVFGSEWDQHADGCNPSIRLPGETLRMIDEVTSIDRLGGPRGLGELTSTKELDPQGWYFACHFTGDPVLAGSLVAEGGVQLLQVYAMYLGLHLVLPDAEFQAVPGLKTRIKVRGQITPETPRVSYRAEITEITMLPRPTLVADLTIYDGDKAIISVQDFGIQVREKPGTPYRPGPGGVPPFLGRRNHTGEAAYINELHLAHAAKGDLAVTMGPEFEIYADRRAPYLPNGDFRFVDRIMQLVGTRGVLKPGAWMDSEYDAPPEAWYFTENTMAGLPNCVVMESSLQAAILLGYYLGATLEHPRLEFSLRNLDGHATYVRDVNLRGKTIRQRTHMLSSQAVPGTVLQRFRYELAADGEVFYRGESLFGYFTAEGLREQIGLDGGRCVAPWLDRQELDPSGVRTLPVRTDDRWFACDDTAPRLGDGHLRLVDEASIVEGGGDHGLGYVRATRQIAADDWYFDCHFHRDPVMPGSLGVEAMIQALQVFVRDTGLAEGIERPVFGTPTDVEMGWRYRGQILRTDREMVVDLHVREVQREGDRVRVVADGSVWRTPADGSGAGLRIYELTGLAVEVRSGDTTSNDEKGER